MKFISGKLIIISDKRNVVPYFKDENFEDFGGSLPDIIAVENRIKPATRFTINSMETAIKFLLFCKENNFCWHIPKTSNNIKYAFISKSQKVIKELEKIESKFFYEDDIKTPQRKIISRFLGYPLCCINAHIKDDRSFGRVFDGNVKNMSFLFNNFLNPVSNLYLSFHSPCSLNCSRTKKYNTKIILAISKTNTVFAKNLKNHLKKPTIVFGSLTSYNDFWNSRFVILLDGSFSAKNEIIYDNVFKAIPFEDNFLMDVFEEKFNILYRLLKGGDRVVVEDNYFEVYENNKLIGKCDRYKEYASAIFNFK